MISFAKQSHKDYIDNLSVSLSDTVQRLTNEYWTLTNELEVQPYNSTSEQVEDMKMLGRYAEVVAATMKALEAVNAYRSS